MSKCTSNLAQKKIQVLLKIMLKSILNHCILTILDCSALNEVLPLLRHECVDRAHLAASNLA